MPPADLKGVASRCRVCGLRNALCRKRGQRWASAAASEAGAENDCMRLCRGAAAWRGLGVQVQMRPGTIGPNVARSRLSGRPFRWRLRVLRERQGATQQRGVFPTLLAADFAPVTALAFRSGRKRQVEKGKRRAKRCAAEAAVRRTTGSAF